MPSYSSQCQPIADKVKDLDADITSAQKSLQSAAPGAKSAILARIRDLQSQKTTEQGLLNDCVRKHPYIPPPPPPKNPCLGIKKKVNDLEEQLSVKIQKGLAPLQKQLQHATSGEKSTLLHQIQVLRNDLTRNSDLAKEAKAKEQEYEQCIVSHGGLLELQATFSGKATMYTSDSDAPGPYTMADTIGLLFSEWNHANVTITSFPPLSATFDTPLGANTTTVTLIAGSGTYNPDGYLTMTLDLHFHHTLVSDSRLHITLKNVEPMDSAGKVAVMGSAPFQDGYLDGDECTLQVKGAVMPHP
jgi:hypothetical protein